MKYFKEMMHNAPEAVIILTPFVMYAMYKMALEVWCIAYGLIY